MELLILILTSIKDANWLYLPLSWSTDIMVSWNRMNTEYILDRLHRMNANFISYFLNRFGSQLLQIWIYLGFFNFWVIAVSISSWNDSAFLSSLLCWLRISVYHSSENGRFTEHVKGVCVWQGIISVFPMEKYRKRKHLHSLRTEWYAEHQKNPKHSNW